MIVIVILAVLSLIIISKLITKASLIIRQYQLLKKVPGPPIDSIFLGHAAEILSSSSGGSRVLQYSNLASLVYLLHFIYLFIFLQYMLSTSQKSYGHKSC